MPKCKMCGELTIERDRILKSYRADKKAWRKEKKWLYYAGAGLLIAIAVLVCVIIIMSVGVEDSIKVIDATKDLIRG